MSNYFVQMPIAIFRDGTISPRAKTVLGALLTHANHETGHAWPSNETLAGYTGITRRGVIRAKQELEARGLIKRVGKSKQWVCIYKIDLKGYDKKSTHARGCDKKSIGGVTKTTYPPVTKTTYPPVTKTTQELDSLLTRSNKLDSSTTMMTQFVRVLNSREWFKASEILDKEEIREKPLEYWTNLVKKNTTDKDTREKVSAIVTEIYNRNEKKLTLQEVIKAHGEGLAID